MRPTCFTIACLAAIAAAPATAHENEVQIGRNGAARLVVRLVGRTPFAVPDSVFPGIDGWATGLFGFHSQVLDEPDRDFFGLPDSVHLHFTLVSADDGLRVLNDHGSDWLHPGETFELGVPFFDVHPLVNIFQGDVGDRFTLRLTLQDTTGQLDESDVISIVFTPEPPCAADWNFSGAVNSQDLFDFLSDFFAGDADFNDDEITNSQDLFDYLAAFFVDC